MSKFYNFVFCLLLSTLAACAQWNTNTPGTNIVSASSWRTNAPGTNVTATSSWRINAPGTNVSLSYAFGTNGPGTNAAGGYTLTTAAPSHMSLGWQGFTLTSTNPAASAYNIVAIAFNGRTNIAVITGTSVQIFTNNGAGAFGSNSVITWDTHSPNMLAVADVDMNGSPDLLIQDTDNTVMVATNNGAGVFGSNAVVTAAAANLYAIAVGDVNGDGKPDFAVSDDLASIQIFTNNAGKFTSSQTIGALQSPTGMQFADINGDGKQDMVFAAYNGTPTALYVAYTNNGAGQLVYQASYPGSQHPTTVLLTDINGDGKPDLIAGGYYDQTNFVNNLLVFTNTGNGIFATNTFRTSTGYPSLTPSVMVAADVKRDGRIDVLTVGTSYNGTGYGINVYTNNGTVLSYWGQATFGTVDPASFIAVDINADLWADIISVNSTDNLEVLQNQKTQ